MARQIASSWEGRVARRLREKVEMLFAHLKRILKLDRLRLRGPNGARDEFLLAATAQNLRKLAKLIPMPSPHPARDRQRLAIEGLRIAGPANLKLLTDLFNKITHNRRRVGRRSILMLGMAAKC